MMDIPGEITTDTPQEDLNIIYRFISNFVVNLYGKRYVKEWTKKNKGSSLLDMITMSDVAYSLTLVDNNVERWEQAHMISELPKDEREKWKTPRKLPADERNNYIKIEPKYTSKKNNKGVYKRSGMSEEGIQCYNTHWEAWKRLARNKSSWELLQIGWDTYVDETGMSEHWVHSSGDITRTVSKEVEDELTIPDDAFCMPGDEGYENDRAEVVGEGSVRKNDHESDDGSVSEESVHSDEDGDEEEEELVPKLPKRTSSRTSKKRKVPV